MKDFAGLASYNMIAKRDDLRRLEIPSYEGMDEFIKRQQVDREGGTSFVAGISTTLVVMELCEIRNLYFGFESGPIVDAGGELYLPLKVEAMVQGDSDIYTKVGTAVLLYSHPERYFSFSTIIDLNVAVAQVGGTLGFEYSPACLAYTSAIRRCWAGESALCAWGWVSAILPRAMPGE